MKKVSFTLVFMFLMLLTSCKLSDKYYEFSPIKVGDSKEDLYKIIYTDSSLVTCCCSFGRYTVFTLRKEKISYIITFNEEMNAKNIDAFKEIKTTKRKIDSLKSGDDFISCIKKVGIPEYVDEYEDRAVFNFVEEFEDNYIEVNYYIDFELKEDSVYYLL